VHTGLIDASVQPALILARRCVRGLLTYRAGRTSEAWEIATSDAAIRGVSVGSALIAALRARASAQGARPVAGQYQGHHRLLCLYQSLGSDLVALHRDACKS
jgi:hypothetical protein